MKRARTRVPYPAPRVKRLAPGGESREAGLEPGGTFGAGLAVYIRSVLPNYLHIFKTDLSAPLWGGLHPRGYKPQATPMRGRRQAGYPGTQVAANGTMAPPGGPAATYHRHRQITLPRLDIRLLVG